MRRRLSFVAAAMGAIGIQSFLSTPSRAQTPDDSPLVTRMMAFDKNHDGKLSKDEVSDERLYRLFDRADANHDGIVTREELTALAAKESSDEGMDRPGGPGGPGGDRAFGGPAIGTLLPSFIQDRLQLSEEQKKQVQDLQMEVDKRLANILTAEQNRELAEMRTRGPGGPGGNRRGGPPRMPTSQPAD
jgi:hypothetical protein